MKDRNYFIYAKKTFQDGSDEYTSTCSVTSYRSWFPQPFLALKEVIPKLEEKMKSDFIEIVSFNRV